MRIGLLLLLSACTVELPAQGEDFGLDGSPADVAVLPGREVGAPPPPADAARAQVDEEDARPPDRPPPPDSMVAPPPPPVDMEVAPPVPDARVEPEPCMERVDGCVIAGLMIGGVCVGEALDTDGDGLRCGQDCDDEDSEVGAPVPERCNGIDDDCDGEADEGICECSGFELRGGRYLVCDVMLPWQRAQRVCQVKGGDLVTLTERDEAIEVHERASAASGRDRHWIGLHDRGEERNHRWVDGEPLGYERWSGGQPDNFFDEDCVEVWSTSRWNDFPCDAALAFICEL